MNIKTSTKNELKSRSIELENEFNDTRDKLVEFIQSTRSTIEEMTKHMDQLLNEYKETINELDKRDGKTGKQ